MNIIKTRIQYRTDSHENWSDEPLASNGELVFVNVSDEDDIIEILTSKINKDEN